VVFLSCGALCVVMVTISIDQDLTCTLSRHKEYCLSRLYGYNVIVVSHVLLKMVYLETCKGYKKLNITSYIGHTGRNLKSF
jgi:hypothetical protein